MKILKLDQQKTEKITTFQGSTLTLTKEDLVWAKDNYVLSVAGAIGEKHNSISNSTKNILLEAANYDRANIRKSVYKHNLLTEAGIRHEKDLDPNMVEGAIARFIYFIKIRLGRIWTILYTIIIQTKLALEANIKLEATCRLGWE